MRSSMMKHAEVFRRTFPQFDAAMRWILVSHWMRRDLWAG